jgi:hypothetical protein
MAEASGSNAEHAGHHWWRDVIISITSLLALGSAEPVQAVDEDAPPEEVQAEGLVLPAHKPVGQDFVPSPSTLATATLGLILAKVGDALTSEAAKQGVEAFVNFIRKRFSHDKETIKQLDQLQDGSIGAKRRMKLAKAVGAAVQHRVETDPEFAAQLEAILAESVPKVIQAEMRDMPHDIDYGIR